MAIIRSGILGNTRGKVAGVVGSQWKDKNYLREYVKPANPNTAAQIAQRALMSSCVAFAKPLVGPLFNAYTDRFNKGMSGFNRFIKDNIAEFVAVPTWGNITIIAGPLSYPGFVQGTYNTATGEVILPWLTNYGNNGSATDKVFWIIYNKDTGLFYFADGEVDRSVATDSQTIPTGLTASDLYAWVFAAKYVGSIVTMVSNAFVTNLTAP